MKLQQEANRKIIELADRAQNEAIRLSIVYTIYHVQSIHTSVPPSAHHNHFTALFWDHPGEPVPEESFSPDNLGGRHSIRTNQQSTSINAPPIFMPDALPAATLPIYPCWDRHRNMLD